MMVGEDQGTKNNDLIIAASEHARKPVWQEWESKGIQGGEAR